MDQYMYDGKEGGKQVAILNISYEDLTNIVSSSIYLCLQSWITQSSGDYQNRQIGECIGNYIRVSVRNWRRRWYAFKNHWTYTDFKHLWLFAICPFKLFCPSNRGMTSMEVVSTQLIRSLRGGRVLHCCPKSKLPSWQIHLLPLPRLILLQNLVLELSLFLQLLTIMLPVWHPLLRQKNERKIWSKVTSLCIFYILYWLLFKAIFARPVVNWIGQGINAKSRSVWSYHAYVSFQRSCCWIYVLLKPWWHLCNPPIMLLNSVVRTFVAPAIIDRMRRQTAMDMITPSYVTSPIGLWYGGLSELPRNRVQKGEKNRFSSLLIKGNQLRAVLVSSH